ncbi:membrane-associated protein, putative [Bodo saltans]|uniref:Membrane-associated protein, putative n=1 Tax=Bodo saltans TaxID=75058 RepID=A0A0S4JAJ8_BODSA|nr:membrane-associated protein, putative [Bodo saltans]|eukprot:CUG86018.1 membrane-associated protein, putative [Bodo saltans]
MRRTAIRLNEVKSDVMREVWGRTKLFMGRVVCFAFGFGAGGLLCARNVTLEIAYVKFITVDCEHRCSARLEDIYKLNVQGLKDDSDAALRAISKPLSEAEQSKILETTIAHILVPTSYDSLFGRDVVFYNEKGKLTVLDRDEFDAIRQNWRTVLNHFGVRECVRAFRNGRYFDEYDRHVVDDVLITCRNEMKMGRAGKNNIEAQS